MSTAIEELKKVEFSTPFGQMVAVASVSELVLLEFLERKNLEKEMMALQKINSVGVAKNHIHDQIIEELDMYFKGKLKVFKTPFKLTGTPFQKQVWEALLKIPFGETRSYLDQAKMIQKPSAFRAVANANGCNQLAIIVPCHRVIQSNGRLGGYGGGVERKQQLLNLEESVSNE